MKHLAPQFEFPILLMNFHDKMPLTSEGRRDWLLYLAGDIRSDFIGKFKSGEKEHGCDIGSVTTDELMRQLYMEQLDSLAYLAEIKRRLVAGNDLVVSHDLLAKINAIIHREVIIGNLPPVEQATLNQLNQLLSSQLFAYKS